VEVREIASAVAALLPSSPARCDEVDKEEESWQRKRMEKQDERRNRANEERAERRRLIASRRASERDAEPAIPVPKPFIVLREVRLFIAHPSKYLLFDPQIHQSICHMAICCKKQRTCPGASPVRLETE
jgi:hypothetical protein